MLVSNEGQISLNDLDQRSRAIFRQIVETYLDTGEPVGSRTVSQSHQVTLSAATIRNVMADLEHMGLLHAPHTSAGRIPTQPGLRLFVDALLQVGDLSESERENIKQRLGGSEHNLEDTLTQATAMLSGLSQCAGLIVTPKVEAPLKHVEFVSTGPGQALVVIVTEGGAVENRVVAVPHGMPPAALAEATNFLNARIRGRTLSEITAEISAEIEQGKAQLDALTAKLLKAGLVDVPGAESSETPSLIVRGRANLLEDIEAAADLERVRMLFDDLENKRDLIQLMESAKDGDGVKIFIGSENKLFSLSGSSLIVSPYMDSDRKVIGALGVIGPTRLNYARVIPLVDYTAKVVGRVVS